MKQAAVSGQRIDGKRIVYAAALRRDPHDDGGEGMILTGVVLGSIAAAYLAIALLQMYRLGLSLRQALLYVPFKLAYRIDDRSIQIARGAEAPVVYVVTHQSRIDPALMLSLLPDDTLHILDERRARMVGAMARPSRTIAFTLI
jgi:acyl-[acyl-carrier-protein]-phospholipid O-acyltransferase/long-chain-fatty-acid--[acyl-carrier-protein] ligase